MRLAMCMCRCVRVGDILTLVMAVNKEIEGKDLSEARIFELFRNGTYVTLLFTFHSSTSTVQLCCFILVWLDISIQIYFIFFIANRNSEPKIIACVCEAVN